MLKTICGEVAECRRCARLVEWRERVGAEKRKAFRDQEYWARPVPGFGDPAARLLILGLAPAAHGANRTGRMFTGDRSGDWLYALLELLQVEQRPLADPVGVHDGEVAFEPELVHGEQVDEDAACFLRVRGAYTEIDDACRDRTAAVVDQFAEVAVEGDENLSLPACIREHLGIGRAGSDLDHGLDRVPGRAEEPYARDRHVLIREQAHYFAPSCTA